MPKIAPSSSPLWALKYAAPCVSIPTKMEKWGSVYNRPCVCAPLMPKGWSWPQPLTAHLRFTADFYHSSVTSDNNQMRWLAIMSVAAAAAGSLKHGWVMNLYRQSAHKWVFTAIKSCLIQVMAHRKTSKIHNDSVGKSRCQCAHFSGYVKHELYVVKGED